MNRYEARGLQVLAHLATLSPLAILLWDLVQTQLTVNPIQEIQLRTGRYALVMLVLSLAVTPANRIFTLRWMMPLRRWFGIYAFGYASLHALNFVGLDYGFDFSLIWEDIGEKRYVLAGLAAYLSLLPLAITSTRGWMRRLGHNWERLHWLVYPVGLLAVTHFLWQVKADIRVPLFYGAVVVLLLILRLPGLRKALRKAD